MYFIALTYERISIIKLQLEVENMLDIKRVRDHFEEVKKVQEMQKKKKDRLQSKRWKSE